jgi:hypothetical protein
LTDLGTLLGERLAGTRYLALRDMRLADPQPLPRPTAISALILGVGADEVGVLIRLSSAAC